MKGSVTACVHHRLRDARKFLTLGSATSSFVIFASRQPCVCIGPIDLLPPTSPSSSIMSTTSSNTTRVPEIPPHWVFERENHPTGHSYFCWRPFTHFLHHLFCAIGFGHSSMHTVWENAHPDCPVEIWEAGRNLVRERMQHINIVVRFRRSLG